MAMPFAVIPAGQVREVLDGRVEQVTGVIEHAYRLHGEGQTVNPDSCFLRLPDRPSARIIALPASVRGEVDVHGIKWISSFPDNLAGGLPRASAVTILNDTSTGFPFACLESSVISATRTAASAALAARELARARGPRPATVGFFGAGLIARYVHKYLIGNGFVFDRLGIFDVSVERAAEFGGYVQRTEGARAVAISGGAEELIRSADLIVFATTAGQPHVKEPGWFDHNPLVLHLSLRDLTPDVILSAFNVVDDVEHCLKAQTSPHLAEQLTGGREFLAGTLYDVLTGTIAVPADRTVVFSPFGLGVLDLALARHVYHTLAGRGQLRTVPDFYMAMMD